MQVRGRSVQKQSGGFASAGYPPGTVGDYIDDVPAGAVVVLDNAGRDDATVWGDILTDIAHRRGIAGTVIDGICRDVALSLSLQYPIYSKGSWMRTGKDRVQVEATQVPVTIGKARVLGAEATFDGLAERSGDQGRVA